MLKYGRESVFRDIDSVPFGSDFRKAIDEALKDADIFIAVVGPNWRGVDKAGKARINDESDLVRIEVETALKRKIPVVPVLVGGATMPQPTELPDSLRDFSFRNAAGIDSGRNFDADVKRLIRSMDYVIQDTPARPVTRKASSAAAQRQIVEPPQKPTSPSVEPVVPRPQTASSGTGQRRVTYPVVAGLSAAIAVLAVVCFWLIYRPEPQPVVSSNPDAANANAGRKGGTNSACRRASAAARRACLRNRRPRRRRHPLNSWRAIFPWNICANPEPT